MVAVAFSGGRDSTALLHATAAAAARLGLRVLALHVHHGLSPQADHWEGHAARLCERWARRGKAVAFASHRVAGKPARGESVEAWARRARYGALRAMALEHGADLVLLAHHRRDQAETFLLQALRGGGAEALSAMPRVAEREGITWARPWLDRPREAIEAYAKRHRLQWIEDESNADSRFARNRLRHGVWSALLEAFPDAESTLASAAQRSQDGAAAAKAWADADRAAIVDGDIEIARWRALPSARQAFLLRQWLRERAGNRVPGTLVERLLIEVPARGSRRWPCGAGEVRSHRGRLRIVSIDRDDRSLELQGEEEGGSSPRSLDLSNPGVHPLADFAGSFAVRRTTSGGISPSSAAGLTVRRRLAGDRFQAGPGRPPRSLKLQYQAAGVASWDRDGPLLCDGEAIVFVAGLGMDARALAAPGEPQLAIEWRPG